ncbi:glycerophosphodiester phosphodiesterase family protein [Siphonobacter sp. SORGH_AS_1065]|uniref:glycerophosphodiester phosphodiesterase family protein n=1 Tax=Siphonobacter sp. SORGH_AS_1065 TaxID=3041795 RepID=UPI00278A57F0|nr:glycerophosphodiester phosphodiesterase family protein [Siphonobacter sp. SORGH_AS_1065]MDQ1086687.1 glycerophosphoryl diester phosphodiesterase [Siphonobacter sp. SORGH_AS_1065]
MRYLYCLLLFLTNPLLSAQTLDIQGHRGCRGIMPENTIPAFLKALELGVSTLELDVVISKDKQVVVSHDNYMNAAFTTKPDGTEVTKAETSSLKMYTLDYAIIQRYDVGKRQNPTFPEQASLAAVKPLLSEVITNCDAYAREHRIPPPHYSIEIKSASSQYGLFQPYPEEFCSLVYHVLKPLLSPDRYSIQSFDLAILKYWKSQQLIRSFDANALSALVHHQSLARTEKNLGFRPDIFSPFYRFVSKRKIKKAKQKGVKIIPWTVNSPQKMLRLRKMGVDGFITDFPNRAKKL